jgi:hypothetical protein
MVVGFPDDPLARQPCGQEGGGFSANDGLSGVWKCVLETRTPLCIKSLFDRLAPPANKPAFLPGSSLRGMLRNTFQVLGAGCSYSYDWPGRNVPGEHSDLVECNRYDACPMCRVFGFVEGDFSWGGKVRFCDSEPLAVQWVTVSVPKERPPNPDGDGWMIFPVTPATNAGQFPCWCVPEYTQFRFRMDYWNLSEEEFDVLKFALTLRYDPWKIALLHTLGYAKSAGLGACKITITDDKSRAVGAGPENFLERYIGQAFFAEFEYARDVRNLEGD